MWAFYGNLWAKKDNLMETSYLEAHPFGKRYPEWMPNFPSEYGQDSYSCPWGFLGPQSVHGPSVPQQKGGRVTIKVMER